MTLVAGDPGLAGHAIASAARILVVDDDPSVRELVANCLRRAGFDVAEAASGELALELLDREEMSLVVLDVGLPGMSGTDVVRTLRQAPHTATLPVILLTGSGDEYPLETGLGAGADDYLPKPVRLEELVARVGAHLRSHAAWFSAVEDELRRRSSVIEALGHLTLSSSPEQAAETVVAELGRRTDCDLIAVAQLLRGECLQDLATFERQTGVRRIGRLLSADLSRHDVDHAKLGPWTEDVWTRRGGETAVGAAADVGIGAGAPIYAGGNVVGLLWLGVSRQGRRPTPDRKSSLLAAAIDYASILSAVAGTDLSDRREIADTREKLELALAAREFTPVFQPVVRLDTADIVGYEALTRFHDGTRPDVRFAEAARVGLGHAYELAAVEAALAAAARLPEGAFLTLNVSPGVVLEDYRRLGKMMQGTARRLVLELTEHVPVDDYAVLREAIDSLGSVEVAIDDAGAGYASLRHILELRPAFAKLDISLVQNIDGDRLRQALVAGLVYFAESSGCHLIAEGVESEEEASALVRLGVEFAQGYLFGHPRPIAG
jgi:EAL domain-containing protein (putative c-di-GMP-specific phosphodiesterase class I)/DNA-binding response OmpR family regulator